MTDITNERLILSALIKNEAFSRKTQAFIKDDYFHNPGEKIVLGHIQNFIEKYSAMPNLADLLVKVKNDDAITETQTGEALQVVEDIFDIEPSNNSEYLVEVAEKFCADKAMFNAIQQAIEIYKGESKLTVHSIQDLMRDAMAVSFDVNVGQEYLDDAEKRWDYYSNPANKIPFDIESFNENTNGGVTRKTLNLLIAGINVGKTMSLISLACMYMRMGLNVLYCSGEMAEEQILNRADANMLGVPINDVMSLGKDVFLGRIQKMRSKSYGKLFVKEFPTGTGTAARFRHAVHEIRIKKRVQIDVIIVDYLQITTSSNVKGDVNSYTKYKAVAEEIRALCVEENAIGWTAAQFNRGGLDNSDPGMGDVGESTGIPATVDGMWAVVRSDELDEVGQLLVSTLKSRYGNKSKPKFTIGVNIDTQTLYDVSKSEQRKFVTHSPTKPAQPPAPERKKATEGSSNKTLNRFKGIKVSED